MKRRWSVPQRGNVPGRCSGEIGFTAGTLAQRRAPAADTMAAARDAERTHHAPICLNEGWKWGRRQTRPTQMNNKTVLMLEVGTADKIPKKKKNNNSETKKRENHPNTQNLLHGAPDKTCLKKINAKMNHGRSKVCPFQLCGSFEMRLKPKLIAIAHYLIHFSL